MMLAAAITLILAQASVPAGIVYLDCTFAREGQPQKQMTVTLNEAAGTVDYTAATAGAQRRTARYTADAVYFIGFTLSRVDLSLTRNAMFMGKPMGIERGKCRIIEPKARAF